MRAFPRPTCSKTMAQSISTLPASSAIQAWRQILKRDPVTSVSATEAASSSNRAEYPDVASASAMVSKSPVLWSQADSAAKLTTAWTVSGASLRILSTVATQPAQAIPSMAMK